ncbi:TetR/AcrR family transcriptional regulator [Actinokineospora fastidiosa]|uniref:TetR family transcriptional regulator n=1 Tax=Actinokineospora fastidiosa TaxID=1816 RepID=A0A918LEU8_9PSEU|nr:TetR/AcrR family transcriptional regulator [Actinokineospora fastidiosa]GGS36888.1 TetR family transcriptional regulator [Actinokineospora fastidiosa]
MAKQTRLATREGNRAKLMAAARAEFAERGYPATKVDAVAARAGLTRGAVYSNFPSKRALYFAVLAEDAEAAAADGGQARKKTQKDALGALARAFVARLPLATAPTHLGAHLLSEVMADDRTRQAYTQLMKLSALQIGFALGHLGGTRPRVRQAEAALTILEGARQFAAAAPGLVEPFHIVQTCENLPDLETAWRFPDQLPPTKVLDDPWSPGDATDLAHDAPADLTSTGLVAILGVHRLSAIEEAIREMPDNEDITLVVVSADPGELVGLVRLTVAETRAHLRQAFPPASVPRLRVVVDPDGTIAAAAGVTGVSDTTEVALRIAGGRIKLRSEGFAACAASSLHDTKAPR